MANDLVHCDNLTIVPAVIAQAGWNSRFAYDEFFEATLNNPHTRRAYGRIINRLLDSCQQYDLELHRITPGLAGDYIGQLEGVRAYDERDLQIAGDKIERYLEELKAAGEVGTRRGTVEKGSLVR